ncbi:MAG: hypothetical protein ACI4IK_01585 [Eubacterium sp.]
MPRGQNANSLKNLEKGKATQFSGERAAIEGSKGGKATARNKKAKQREAEEWAELLSLAMNEGIEEDITSLKDAKTKNISISKAMKLKLITEALKGNIKAYECIMRYAGADEEEPATQEEERQEDNSFIKALNARAEDLWKNETADTKEDKTE